MDIICDKKRDLSGNISTCDKVRIQHLGRNSGGFNLNRPRAQKVLCARVQPRPYPLYMIDASSFSGVVQTLWMDYTAWISNTDTRERYSDFYFSGVELDSLSINSLIKAKQLLDKGDLDNAKKYYEYSIRYEALSDISFQAAQNIFENNFDAAEELAQQLYSLSKFSSTLISRFVPQAAPIFNAIYSATDYAITSQYEGVDEANKNLLIDQIVSLYFTDIIFDEKTGGNLIDVLENRVGKKSVSHFRESNIFRASAMGHE